MAKWNASVGLRLTIDYDDIEADTKEEASQIAKDRALEDIDWNNCSCDVDLDHYGWGANPYVFVIEFERCEKPEGV